MPFSPHRRLKPTSPVFLTLAVPDSPGICVAHAEAGFPLGLGMVDVIKRRPLPLLLALSRGTVRGSCVPAGQICLSQAGSQDQPLLLPDPCWRAWHATIGPHACEGHWWVTQPEAPLPD